MSSQGPGFWVVKGDPSRNDFKAMVVKGEQQDWITKKPPKSWKLFDKMLLWASSPVKRLVGLATLSAVSKPSNGVTTFTLEYVSDCLSDPVGIDDLRADEIVGAASFLKAGPAATVQRVTAQEMARMLELISERNPKAARKAAAWLTEIHGRESVDSLRVLSIRPAFARAIVMGEKDVENRSWVPPATLIGDWFVIHASEKLLDEDIEYCRERLNDASRFTKERIVRGAIVGLARLSSCTEASDSRWYWPGNIAWNIDDAIALKRPIPLKGKLGLWRLPPEVKKKVLAQLPKRVPAL